MSPDLSLIYCLWPGCGRVFLQLFMAAIFCCRSYGKKKKKNAVLEVMLWKIFFTEVEEAIFYPHITSPHPLPSHGHNNPSLRDPLYRERWPPGFLRNIFVYCLLFTTWLLKISEWGKSLTVVQEIFLYLNNWSICQWICELVVSVTVTDRWSDRAELHSSGDPLFGLGCV